MPKVAVYKVALSTEMEGKKVTDPNCKIMTEKIQRNSKEGGRARQ